MTVQDGPVPPIAIIGIGLRLPGGVSTTDGFWDLLVSKRNTASQVPRDRWNAGAFHDPKLGHHSMASDQGCFLKDVNFKHFDASCFSMSRAEVEAADPQQRILLEVVWECMESAGQVDWRGKEIGCYLGSFGEDYKDRVMAEPLVSGQYVAVGVCDFVPPNRVSYEYNLTGPSMTIRTACSSSLVGLHEACQGLYSRQCCAAIVAGTNLVFQPQTSLLMADSGFLSPTGSSKSFDASADGYVRGEAVNAICIKLLDDALRDGDPIRAVIRSTAVNADGKSGGFTVPNGKAQERLMRRAYKAAGIDDISETPLVECHGTGTKVGDPIEANSVARVFGARGTYITSVKPNIGHSEGSAGLSSLIKAVLALEHETIPPNINFVTPHPKIPFAQGRLMVPVDPTPWPKGRAARVSVNSFGIGGSNAHVIVESAASFRATGRVAVDGVHQVGDQGTQPRLLLISANGPESVRRRANDVNEYYERQPPSFDAMAYTLSSRRQHLPYRASCVATRADDSLEFGAPRKSESTPPDLVFVFTGQGAQWAGMARELLQYVTVRSDIGRMDEVLQSLEEPPSWTIQGMLCSDDGGGLLDRVEYAQTLCTAVQTALVNLLARCNVRAAAVVGHSSGEIAAAFAAGELTLDDAIVNAYHRGEVIKSQAKRGAMAAIGMGREAAAGFVSGDTTIACENSPQSVTISGDEDAIQRTLESIEVRRPGTFSRRLRVDRAYHSDGMVEAGAKYETLLSRDCGQAESAETRVPRYSSVTGELLPHDQRLGPAYWRRNLECPVLFSSAVSALLDDGDRPAAFVEIGPHAALEGPLRQILGARDRKHVSYVATQRRGQDSGKAFLEALGEVFCLGHAVDLCAISPKTEILTNLPNYPWNHQAEYWNESRLSLHCRQRKHGYHELLGVPGREASQVEPSWRNLLNVSNVPWLADHVLGEDIIFPGAGYIAMIGEAIRQLTASDAYSIRHLIIQSAMILDRVGTTEMVTSARPLRLTDRADSPSWYEFTISSFNGSAWARHCVAQARAGHDSMSALPAKAVESLPRRVSTESWYDHMARLDLKFGPSFRSLTEISANTTEKRATARVPSFLVDGPAHYSIHPVAIDACLQLTATAMSNGIVRRIKKLYVPTAVDHIHVKAAASELLAEATVSEVTVSTVRGSCTAVTSSQEAALVFENATFAPLDLGHGSAPESLPLGSRLKWLPHIDFGDAKHLVRPVDQRKQLALYETFCALCILRVADTLALLEPPTGHLSKYAAWIKTEKCRMQSGEWNATVPEAQDWASQDTAQRMAHLQHLDEMATLKSSRDGIKILKMMRTISDEDVVRQIFTEGKDPLEIFMKGGGWQALHRVAEFLFDYGEFLTILGHTHPALRVLEIGAGSGATTKVVLQGLTYPDGTPAYSSYTFTDISTGFFPAAKKKFAHHTRLTYQALDISKPPTEQGFDLSSHDLIVASHVLHATPSLSDTLRHVVSLLRPGGRLMIQELDAGARWRQIRYIMEYLPGWWVGADDGRESEPLISPQRWFQELRSAGFNGKDYFCVPSDDEVHRHNLFLIARLPEPISWDRRVSLLYCHEKPEFALKLAQRLQVSNFTVRWLKFGDDDSAGEDVISCIDLGKPLLQAISETDLKALLTFLANTQSSVLWLMRPAQVCCSDPYQSMILGLTRIARLELGLQIATLELPKLGAKAEEATLAIFEKVRSSQPSAMLDAEREFVVHEDVVHVGRYYPFDLVAELERSPPRGSTKCLTFGKPGLLDEMGWRHSDQDLDLLTDDHVEIDVRCTGLNFRDLVTVMGLVTSPDGLLGYEASGIVTRVGSLVSHVKVGDRVVCIGSGCFAARVRKPGALVSTIPDGWSFEEAATMPVSFVTAIYSLVNLGQVTKGQSVLIHSACGALGLAAIQICKMLGAEIHASVGSDEKVQYLMDKFGLDRDKIHHSRNASFLDSVLESTHGRGVDLVLNFLAGELLHASWQCVAKYGKMVEVGVRDFIDRGSLPMEPFLDNRSFHGVEVALLSTERPDIAQELMKQCIDWYHKGYIQPLPHQSVEGQRVVEAFRKMQGGTHIGKIVVRMPNPGQLTAVGHLSPSLRLSDRRTFLLVGGLGGLGKAVATWAVERGAHSFVFLSRSAGKGQKDQDFIRELESQGCQCVAVAGSVADKADVRRAIDAAPSPIAGVIQMSMVLKDVLLSDLTYEDWTRVLAPKVQGTWNLHDAFQGSDLEHFVLFGSVAGVAGTAGQASYAAASVFLAAFVQYRHGLGLPCSIVQIGIMETIGYVSEKQDLLKHLRSQNQFMLQEAQFLEALEIAFLASGSSARTGPGYQCPGQLAVGLMALQPASDPNNRLPFKRDARLAPCLIRELGHGTENRTVGDDGMQALVNSITRDPSLLTKPKTLDDLTMLIGRAIRYFLLLPTEEVGIDQNLSALGVDSLVSLEIRNWWRLSLGSDMSVSSIASAGSIRHLGRLAIRQLQKKHGVDPAKDI